MRPLIPHYARAPRPQPRRIGLIVIVTVAHLALTIRLLLLTFTQGMSHFDDGSPPSAMEHVVKGAFHVLSFPLLTPLFVFHVNVPGPASWLLVLANSLCWALAVSFLLDRLGARRAAAGPPGPPVPQR